MKKKLKLILKGGLFRFGNYCINYQSSLTFIQRVFIVCALINTFFFDSLLAQSASSSYYFTIDVSANTSAGVFDKDKLIRKLWSCKAYKAGTYSVSWDGKDDDGNSVKPGSYTIRVLKSNVTYAWEGSHIGNSSSASIGSKVHRVWSNLSDLTISGDKVIYVSDYSERVPSITAFRTGSPQEKENIFDPKASTPDITRVANDGTNYYYAGFDAYQTNISFIIGTKISDNSQLKFTNGQDYSLEQLSDVYHTAGLSKEQGSKITGLTVQAGSKFLIFTRPKLNQIIILDKNSGAIVNTSTAYKNPKSVSFDRKGFIWLSYDENSIVKLAVNNDGSLSKTAVSIDGVTDPGKIDVSFDAAVVGIIDYDSQTLKLFSNLTGKQIPLSIGQPGGYLKSSIVADDKFCFKTLANGNLAAGFCFLPDGSIWIADTGNNRFQHFNANGKFLESIYIPGPCYFTNVDAGNTSRVIGSLLEYKVDYSQPLTGSSGWIFTNNWRAAVPEGYDQFANMHFIKTISWQGQSRTFTMLVKSNQLELVELVKDGTMKFTGKNFGNNALIDDDNNLLIDLKRYQFKGFDGSGLPIWDSAPEILADISSLSITGPTQGYRGRPFVTADDKVVFFNNYTKSSPVDGYHLGIMPKSGKEWLALTEKGTYKDYSGAFPSPEYFDIGNFVNDNSGSNVNVLGRNIFAGYHGENWKAAQTNKFNHYWSDGLAIGQFGTTTAETIGEAPAMLDGNALSPQVVAGENSDVAYLYHGGEINHGGIHRWRITGLNSVKEQLIDIVYPSVAFKAMVVQGIDLMQGLVSGTLLARGQNGWDGDPEENTSSKYLTATIGYASYIPGQPDLNMVYANSTSKAERSITRQLQTSPKKLNAWNLNGKINFNGTNANYEYQGSAMMEILDNNNNIITQFSLRLRDGGFTLQIVGNDKILMSQNADTAKLLTDLSQPFSIILSDNKLIFNYAGYSQTTTSTIDANADIHTPATLRFHFNEIDNNARGRRIDVQELRFFNKVSQEITFPAVNSKNLGIAPFLLNAHASSNLPVIYTVLSGPAQLSGNLLSIIGQGEIVIQATQEGNATYDPAIPVLQKINVNPPRKDL